MNARERFEREFHSRTVAYQPGFRHDDRPVVVELGPGAHTPAGHALACALANLLARAHQRIVFVGELDAKLLSADPFGSDRLHEATLDLCQRINPLIAVDSSVRRPKSEALATITIGCAVARSDLSLGCSRWQARTGANPPVGEGPADAWGAMLAACLGSWFAFQRLLGENPQVAESYSLWEYGRIGGGQGPELLALPDLGRILQVGAGGVGAALDYWLAVVGTGGVWTISDGDIVEFSNLNRQLSFLAADAGYPDADAANKAVCAAARIPARTIASPHWYGTETAIVEAGYDVILALANERGVRGALQDRGAELLLHATTSINHQAQFHRHARGLDDCIRCRLRGQPARLGCSQARVDDQSGDDAALPFLSGLAGLMLAAALARLGEGALTADPRNLAIIDLGGASPSSQQLRSECEPGCRSLRAA